MRKSGFMVHMKVKESLSVVIRLTTFNCCLYRNPLSWFHLEDYFGKLLFIKVKEFFQNCLTCSKNCVCLLREAKIILGIFQNY